MKHYSNLDMVLNQIKNLRLEQLTVDPLSAPEGRIYYNTTDKVVRVADGANWTDLGATAEGADILASLSAVDGAGSGLDADTVDGLEAAAFAPAVHTHTASQITDFATVVDARITAAFTNEAIDATVDTIAEFTQLIKDNEAGIANILSIKRFQQNIGDGTANSFTVTHNLNSLDVAVQVVEVSTGATVLVDVVRDGANSVTVGVFNPVPTAAQHRVICLA